MLSDGGRVDVKFPTGFDDDVIVVVDDEADEVLKDDCIVGCCSSWVGVPGSSLTCCSRSGSRCWESDLFKVDKSELVLTGIVLLDTGGKDVTLELDVVVIVGVAVVIEGVAVVTSISTGVLGVEAGFEEVLDTRLKDL